MSEKDDQDWLDEIAGGEAKDADMSTLKEARALRAALLDHAAKDAATGFDREAGLQRLLFRLRRADLLKQEAPRWKTHLSLAIAATLALSTGVGIYFEQQRPDVEDIGRTRGIETVQSIRTDDPSATRDRLVAELTALGAQPRVREDKGMFVIEATWPVKPNEGHVAFLDRHKLKPPDGYMLDIRIEPSKR